MVSAHYVATLTPHSADTCVMVRTQRRCGHVCPARGRCEVGIQPFKLLEIPSQGSPVYDTIWNIYPLAENFAGAKPG